MPWKLLSLCLFPYGAGRKNTSHGFAEFLEENVKEIFKQGPSKLEETPWSDGSSLSLTCVKGLGFFYGSDTSPIFITPEKVLYSQRDRGRSKVHKGS